MRDEKPVVWKVFRGTSVPDQNAGNAHDLFSFAKQPSKDGPFIPPAEQPIDEPISSSTVDALYEASDTHNE